MSADHPIRRAMTVLRIWLGMVVILMMINANVATAYVLGETAKAVPFYFLSFLAFLWLMKVWESRVVILCCVLIVVGVFLRGCEVLFYADQFGLTQRLTGVTLWWFVGGTTLAFGILNLIAVSRRDAEEWIWESQR